MAEKTSRITITGDPGSGKSTFARSVSDFTGFEMITTGNIFRKLAAERNVSITQLNEMAEMQKELDALVDDYLVSLNDRTEPMVLDSRMAWHFVKDTFKVRLSVDPGISVRRIFNDDQTVWREKFSSFEEAMEEVERRRKSEIKRYQNLYGVDISDDRNFDLIIDTSAIHKEEALEKFKTAYKSKG